MAYKSGDSASAGAQTVASVITSINGYGCFDIVIEYEFTGTGREPIGLFVGDSLTEGYKGLVQANSIPHRWGMRSRGVAINAGISSATAQDWITSTTYRWTKWGIGSRIRVPDFAMIWLGTNDIPNNFTQAQIETALRSVRDNLFTLGVARVFIATIIPRSFVAGYEAIRAAENTRLLSQVDGFAGVLDFDPIVANVASPPGLLAKYGHADAVHLLPAGYNALVPLTTGIGRDS